MTILVTGANGFVGRAVCRTLIAAGLPVAAAARRRAILPTGLERRPIGDIGPETDWSIALAGSVEAIVHLAARAHVMTESVPDPLAEFRRINRDGTLALARQAARQGVRRFIFVSTIKVNGEATPPDHPFRAEDDPAPQDPYAIAKAEAEAGLRAIAAETGMLAPTILRPPLVHGPGARGNLMALMRLLRRRLPLPLGAIDNRRSLIGVDNLADAIRFCLNEPKTANATFLARDPVDISTPDLLRRLGRALGTPPLLVPVPLSGLRLIGRISGRMGNIDRLCGSLVVDDSPLRALGWHPPLGLDDGLRRMAKAFLTRS